MNELDRMKQLAGILVESTSMRQTLGEAVQMDTDLIREIADMPHDAAKHRALEVIMSSSTTPKKKGIMADSIERTRNTVEVAKILYSMVLKGEGLGVLGSNYSKKFDEGFDEDVDGIGDTYEISGTPPEADYGYMDEPEEDMYDAGADMGSPWYIITSGPEQMITGGPYDSQEEASQCAWYDQDTHHIMQGGEDENGTFNPIEPMQEQAGMNNGYGEGHQACGDDYFPNGAESPITRDVGPSGGRYGDNPEQKHMQVSESDLRAEIVELYSRFLAEQARK